MIGKVRFNKNDAKKASGDILLGGGRREGTTSVLLYGDFEKYVFSGFKM